MIELALQKALRNGGTSQKTVLDEDNWNPHQTGQTARQIDRQTDRQTDKQTDRQIERQTDNRQTYRPRQTDTQTDRQRDRRQTARHRSQTEITINKKQDEVEKQTVSVHMARSQYLLVATWSHT